MKYIMMMHCPKTGYDTFGAWPKKDFQANIHFMMDLDKALRASGELVSAEGLASPFMRLCRCGLQSTVRQLLMAFLFPEVERVDLASAGSSKSKAPNRPTRWLRGRRPRPDLVASR